MNTDDILCYLQSINPLYAAIVGTVLLWFRFGDQIKSLFKKSDPLEDHPLTDRIWTVVKSVFSGAQSGGASEDEAYIAILKALKEVGKPKVDPAPAQKQ